MSESSEGSEDSNPLPNEEESNPFPNEEESNPFPDEEDSNPFPDEEDSNAFPKEEDTDQLPMEEDTDQLPMEEDTYPLPADDDSNPLTTEEDTNPLPENKRVLRQTNKNASESEKNSSGPKKRNKENKKREGFIRLATPISNAIMKVYLHKLELMKQNASATELEKCDEQMKDILKTAKQKKEDKKKERLSARKETQTNSHESGDMEESSTPIVKVEDVICKIKVIKEEDENELVDKKIVKEETFDEDFQPMPRPKKRERSSSSESTAFKEEDANIMDPVEDESKNKVNKQRKSRKRERSPSSESAIHKKVNSKEMAIDQNNDNPNKLHLKSTKKARSASPENITLIKKEELHIMDEAEAESDKETNSDFVNLNVEKPSVYENEKSVGSENLIYKEETEKTPINTISKQSHLQTFSDPKLVVKLEPVTIHSAGDTTKEITPVETNPKQPRKRGRPPSLKKNKSNILNDTSVTSLTPEISPGDSEVVTQTEKRRRGPSAKKGRFSNVEKSDDTVDSVKQSKTPHKTKETQPSKSLVNSEYDGEAMVKPISRGRRGSVRVVDGEEASPVTPKLLRTQSKKNSDTKQQVKKGSKSSSCETQVSSSSDNISALSKPTLEQKLAVNDSRLKSLADKIANVLRKTPATDSKTNDQEPKKCIEGQQERPPVSGSGSGFKVTSTEVKPEDETNEDYELPDLDEIEFDGLFESYKKDNRMQSDPSNVENCTDIVTIDSSDEETTDIKNEVIVEYKMNSKG